MMKAEGANRNHDLRGVWFYVDEESTGPVTSEVLVSYLAKRDDWRDVLVWTANFVDWQNAGDVFEIVRLVAKPPPVPSKSRSLPAMPPPLPAPQSILTYGGGITLRLRENEWLRFIIFVVALVILMLLSVWAFTSPTEYAAIKRFFSILSLKAASIVGYCFPALFVGATVGWAKFSWRAWLITTLFGLLATIGIYVLTAESGGWYLPLAGLILCLICWISWKRPSDIAKQVTSGNGVDPDIGAEIPAQEAEITAAEMATRRAARKAEIEAEEAEIAARVLAELVPRLVDQRSVQDAIEVVKKLNGSVKYSANHGWFIPKSEIKVVCLNEVATFATESGMVSWIINNVVPKIK